MRTHEWYLAACGVVLLLAAPIVLGAGDDFNGPPRATATVGFGVLAFAGYERALRLYFAVMPGSMPRGVGGRPLVADGSLRIQMGAAVLLAVGLPFAAAVALLVMVDMGWFLLWMGLIFAFAGWAVGRRIGRRSEAVSIEAWPAAPELLDRLCARADMAAPELVAVEHTVATAWTSDGRIHLTVPLLDLLDSGELEAVVAHELAHIAHRDAAVMDITTAPSQALLAGIAVGLHPNRLPYPRNMLGSFFMGIFYVPPAWLLGWASRLGVLGLSRARELSADAAAATLTGRPSALASALLKLDGERAGVPRADLRSIDARGTLSIIEVDPSRFGRILHTHPPLVTRIERLEAMETRLQRDELGV